LGHTRREEVAGRYDWFWASVQRICNLHVVLFLHASLDLVGASVRHIGEWWEELRLFHYHILLAQAGSHTPAFQESRLECSDLLKSLDDIGIALLPLVLFEVLFGFEPALELASHHFVL
jgi:hypothetical protein